MKLRDSGMPAQDYWETLMDTERVLDAFPFGPATGASAELGCGFGTFTIPLARRTGSLVHAFDIDPTMVETTRKRAAEAGLPHVRAELRDVFADGFGLDDGACGACLLFNMLHGESPVELLREAARIVRPGGIVAVIHWRSDVTTPRGPALDIRPTPENILTWVNDVPELRARGGSVILPPWHFGMCLDRRE